ncbi:interleukin 17 receptor A1a [Scomber scombrus]|uniref:interleukin 17 receptor A1a n=1 Tax=Scomber scombrus TaxID=13677 RepID=UPI002DD9E4AB|nr:interleukin 17 receptor A1a [Scomber scombrus]
MTLDRAVWTLMCVALWPALGTLSWPHLSCSDQGLNCTVETSNCFDSSWLIKNEYTPSRPEQLNISVVTKHNDEGHLQPVLIANWKIKDDGSISHLKATELHVLVMSTNENRCIRYSFKEKLLSRHFGEQWSFSAMMVLDPGQTYRLSVFNIPKPEQGHTHYDVSEDITVPGCRDSKMQKTKFCIDRGSLWQSNISVTEDKATSELAVSFNPDTLCEEYIVLVKCSSTESETIFKGNQTSLKVIFSLHMWVRSCCQFDVEIKPIFPQCGQDCRRQKKTLSICSNPTAPPDVPDTPQYTLVALGVVFPCIVIAIIAYALCKKPGRPVVAPVPMEDSPPQQLQQRPKVLVIYSQDHHLYRDIVLKLCAFLQAKCGTEVLVDLLDTTSVGMVGRLRWLEWQRQQLKNPSDKILVLCSQGVQAKWKAMCGHGRVTLKEDILSPTDDMLTPFLNLFLPEMHEAGKLGKYMVAYFNDISTEQDVPSVFDIGIKYKLMKHFEELYFRILDIEKYQPGQVKHIEGIGGDEYSNCPSGEALKNAIETFQAYQLENPDWFEKQCVDNEEEIMAEADQLLDQMRIPPVLECHPLIRDGLPVYIQDIDINENGNSVHILTPELNPQCQLLSVAELTPVVNPDNEHRYPTNLDEVLTDHLYPHSPSPQSAYISDPLLIKPPPPNQKWLSVRQESSCQIPIEHEEEDSLLPQSQLSTQTDHRSSVEQNSMNSSPPQSSWESMQSNYPPLSDISCSQPVEMEEDEVLEPAGKGPSSGSDQGYISKMSSQHGLPSKEDTLVALAKLQEELFQQNL